MRAGEEVGPPMLLVDISVHKHPSRPSECIHTYIYIILFNKFNLINLLCVLRNKFYFVVGIVENYMI